VNANVSSASAQGNGIVTADATLPMAAFTAPTPTTVSTVNGVVTLATTASSPSGGGSSTLNYSLDAAGFRSSRTLNGVTTRYLLGGLIETNGTGAITLFDVDGPIGDVARYTAAPTAGQASVTQALRLAAKSLPCSYGRAARSSTGRVTRSRFRGFSPIRRMTYGHQSVPKGR
jgi:hypothetical protein